MTRAWLRSVCFALLACASASCAAEPVLTQIMVVVRSNVASLDHVEIRVEGLGKPQTASADLAKSKLPRTLAVVYRGGALGPITIRARGLAQSALVVERAARLSFVRGRNVTLVLDLVSACEQVSCSDATQTCIDGSCASNKVDSSTLKTWPGSTSKVDAGTLYVDQDAGGGELDAAVDAHADLDAARDAGDANIDTSVPDGCDSNHDDCNHDGLCETSIVTLENCGACGAKCAFDPGVTPYGMLSCATRTCKVACQTGRLDLDGKHENGCEGVAFSLVPTHFDSEAPALLAKVAPTLTLDSTTCATNVVDFGSAALDADVTVCGQTVHPLLVPQAGGSDVVVVPLLGLDVQAGVALTFAGTRPVVLAVYGDASVAGSINVSAVGSLPGPGGDVSCVAGLGATGASFNSRGGGGGGGSFGVPLGAKGGDGYAGGGAGSAPGAVEGTSSLPLLQGGCAGGNGGAGQSAAGVGGGGGGALQLSAAGTLTVTGTIAAAGGGGLGSAAGNMGGGGGGGSGGAVVLEATALSVSAAAWLTANGGGGGEASSDASTTPGSPGFDGAVASTTAAVGGSGGAPDGGNGGNGASSTAVADAGSNGGAWCPLLCSDQGGGGGGGGGAGRIVLRSESGCSVAGGVSPAAHTTQCM